MKHILLLEEVINEILKFPDIESCIFGAPDFYFPVKNTTGITGPYDFMFYSIPMMPKDLDQEFIAIPFVPGTINCKETRKRIRELKEEFPFLEAFGVTSKGKKGRQFLSIRKYLGLRPIADYPRSPYEVYHVDTKELERETPNSKALMDFISEKIERIKNKYSNQA